MSGEHTTRIKQTSKQTKVPLPPQAPNTLTIHGHFPDGQPALGSDADAGELVVLRHPRVRHREPGYFNNKN